MKRGPHALLPSSCTATHRSTAGFVQSALAEFGRLDVVVNNAGTTHRNQPMLDVTEAMFDRIYRVNVKSLFLSARHVVPHFRSQGGGVFITIGGNVSMNTR